MAVQSVEDNVASRLDSAISDTSEALTVKNEFTSLTVPSEGFLIIGNSDDLYPNSSGDHPSGEVVKYTTFTRNGDGTSTFGVVSSAPITRGWGNTIAQSWKSGTAVGLAISSAYMNIIFNAIVPQDDNNFKYQNIHSDSKINDALIPNGVNELDIRNWYEKAQSGVVSAGDVSSFLITSLANGETLDIDLATFILSDGQAVPSNIDLVIAILDNTGSGTSQVTILNGNGSSVYDKQTGSPLATYTNDSGSSQTVMIGVDNGHWNTGSGGNHDTFVSIVAKVY